VGYGQFFANPNLRGIFTQVHPLIPMRTYSDDEQAAIAKAVKVLADAGAEITVSLKGGKHLCLMAVAARTTCANT